jgi:hypothetical protein
MAWVEKKVRLSLNSKLKSIPQSPEIATGSHRQFLDMQALYFFSWDRSWFSKE